MSQNRKYDVVFYLDRQGKSDIIEMLDELSEKAETSKTDRLNREKILIGIQNLQNYGTRIGAPWVKHLEGDIWEIRPLAHRVLFAYWKDNTFVLLHHFIKKSNKTPPKEIEKAKNRLKDYLERNKE